MTKSNDDNSDFTSGQASNVAKYMIDTLKLFKTNNMDTVQFFQRHFDFEKRIVARRIRKFDSKFVTRRRMRSVN